MIDQLLKATSEKDWQKASSLLYKHWSTACPLAYSSQLNAWEIVVDDKKISNELIYPLAAMFCGEDVSVDSEEKDVSLKKLNEISGIDSTSRRPGQICGRVFKNGEPNYTCKECATDSTCVLCFDCFFNSVHVNHKYKLHTSAGCGYCDCGDPEAWREDFTCKLHSTKKEDGGDEEMVAEVNVPKELESRVYNLSLIAIKFIVNLLCTTELPSFMEDPSSEEQYQTILFNDETHTYDAVIRALELAIHCSSNNAMRLATIVDREGRSIVQTGSRDLCKQVKSTIESRTKRENSRRTQKSGPLEVKVFKASLVSYQTFAVRLLSWLSSRVQQFSPLSAIIGRVLLYACSESDCEAGFWDDNAGSFVVDDVFCTDTLLPACNHGSNCMKLILTDRKLWKAARMNFHQILMSTVLMNIRQKQDFGRLHVRNYEKIFTDFVDDDHEPSISIVSISVQVFTVPTVARYLIVEENVLAVIMRCLTNFCQKYVKVSQYNSRLYQLDFSTTPHPVVLKRAMYMFSDFAYLLCVVPKHDDWTDELRRNFLQGGACFLEFLSIVEGMDEVKRQNIEHQLVESEWETAFNIFIQMQESISLTLAWTRSDLNVHMKLFKKCLIEIMKRVECMTEFSAEMPRIEVKVFSSTAQCIDFEVSKSPLSIHHPLWRFIAGLFAAPPEILSFYYLRNIADSKLELDGETRWNIDESLHSFNLYGYRSILMEMPLRVLVLQAQSHAQLWRRNGFSLVNQVHNYLSHLCRTEMYDRDILLLQVVAALMDADKFLIRVINRFELTRWADSAIEDSRTPIFSASTPSATKEELSKISVFLAEEMLHLLIIIIGERYLPGLSDCTQMQALQRGIIHYLCTGPKPFSQIERVMPNDPSLQRLSLYTAVEAVSDFRKPAPTSSGLFHLKPEFLTEYNPFFYHYSKILMSQADQWQKKERANKSRELMACPPPMPPSFTPFYRPILRLLESPVLIKLLRLIFERVGRRSRFVGDGLFHRALYLTAMGLNEQKAAAAQGQAFSFLTECKKETLFDVIFRLQSKPEAESHAHLLWIVLQRFKEVDALVSTDGKKDGGELIMAEDAETSNSKDEQRARVAARKRQLALERMKKLQTSFKLKEAEVGGLSSSENVDNDYLGVDCEHVTLSEENHFPVCCGANKTEVALITQRRVTCILCQESEFLSSSGNPIVCAGFIERTRMFSVGSLVCLRPMDGFATVDLNPSLNVSTCSHTMHFSCFIVFMNTLISREKQRPRQQMMSSRLTNPENGEYLCPLCKRLSNCALPLLPPVGCLPDIAGFSTVSSSYCSSFESWLTKLQSTIVFSKKKSSVSNRKRTYNDEDDINVMEQIELNKDDVEESNASSSDSSLATNANDLNNIVYGSMPLFDMLRNSESTRMTLFRFADWATGGSSETDSVELAFCWKSITAFFNEFWSAQKKSPARMESMIIYGVIDVLKACAFLVRDISAILAVEEKPLFGAMNTRQRDCIAAMVRLAAVVPLTCDAESIRIVVAHQLSVLLCKRSTMAVGPDGGDDEAVTAAIIQIDMLTLAVQLLATIGWMWNLASSSSVEENDVVDVKDFKEEKPVKSDKTPCLVADGSVDELYVIRLTLLAHIFQIVVLHQRHPPTPENEAAMMKKLRYQQADEDLTNVQMEELNNSVRTRLEELFAAANGRGATLEDAARLYQRICYATIEFLRPLALFYNALRLVPPPEGLKDPHLSELVPLCRYLGLPHDLSELLNGVEVKKLFELWSLQTQTATVPKITLPLRMKLLIDLPNDYSVLINSAAKFRCPSIQADDLTSTVPTLCLTCGAMICSQSYCCQKALNGTNVGACTYHINECGDSCGIFLKIRDCQVVLLTTRGAHVLGCHKAAPYVDEFGETDPGFRRGNPLHLSRELYAKFQRIWIHQEVAEEVNNQYEINNRNMVFEWHNF